MENSPCETNPVAKTPSARQWFNFDIRWHDVWRPGQLHAQLLILGFNLSPESRASTS